VRRYLIGLAAAHLAAGLVGAQSFDCGKAMQADEKIVCGSARLRALDERLGREYRARLAKTPKDGRTALARTQAAWLRRRKACAQAAAPERCVGDLYAKRSEELAAGGKNEMKVKGIYPGARITGKWRVARMETPDAQGYQVQWEDLLEKMPWVGATVVFTDKRFCITDPEDERICFRLLVQYEKLGEIPGGKRIAGLLGLTEDAPYLNLQLDGRAAFGMVAAPDGKLYADFPICPKPDTCTTGFEVWMPEDGEARVVVGE
jgi:uncharacterized protein